MSGCGGWDAFIHPSLSPPPPSLPSFPHHDKLKMEEMCFSWPSFSGCCLNNRVACSTKLNSTSPWKDFLRRETPQHNQGNPTIRQTSPSPQRPKVNAICLTANQITPGYTVCVCVSMCVCMCNTVLYTLKAMLKEYYHKPGCKNSVKLGFPMWAN